MFSSTDMVNINVNSYDIIDSSSCGQEDLYKFNVLYIYIPGNSYVDLYLLPVSRAISCQYIPVYTPIFNKTTISITEVIGSFHVSLSWARSIYSTLSHLSFLDSLQHYFPIYI
jgi:hypothetical protein